ncbi:hypothetical protein ACHHYP_13276 [Achlya hypogyna]|uniref:Ubiquitin-like-conjugating enzyme ATG10 n=1 Tax=Achlya hypogyna TaxID=1202772 RepID=A0A1V9YFP7_ACHHY|nr:hypothetical protein ACHHYP_13276 [Achlya hypogyna]
MALSWTEFRAAANALGPFQRGLLESNDPHANAWNWRWEDAPAGHVLQRRLPGWGFLVSRNNTRFVQAASVADPSDSQWEDSDAEAGEIPHIASGGRPDAAGEASIVFFEYHVVYSPTYEAPVLYVYAALPDGTPLSTDALQTHLQRTLSVHGPAPHLISQDEHPVLGTPSYYLHPCETARCLALLVGQTSPPLVKLLAWFSLVQACTGMAVPPSSAERTHAPNEMKKLT